MQKKIDELIEKRFTNKIGDVIPWDENDFNLEEAITDLFIENGYIENSDFFCTYEVVFDSPGFTAYYLSCAWIDKEGKIQHFELPMYID